MRAGFSVATMCRVVASHMGCTAPKFGVDHEGRDDIGPSVRRLSKTGRRGSCFEVGGRTRR